MKKNTRKLRISMNCGAIWIGELKGGSEGETSGGT